jgi:diguanylate cyclase (GGDEF)-like protein
LREVRRSLTPLAPLEGSSPLLGRRLFSRQPGIFAGALCGIFASWAAACQAQAPAILLAAIGLSSIASLRILAAILFARRRTAAASQIRFYDATGFSYSCLAGLTAALALHLNTAASVTALLFVHAIAYAVIGAARNAGRPLIAIAQLTLNIAPITLAAWLQGDLASRAIALTLGLFLPGMISITLHYFHNLQDSHQAAQNSQRLAENMQLLARTDGVTGLLNRAGLSHALVKQAAAIAPGQKLAVLWLNLERFKEINDSLGHTLGDRLLAETAARLQRAIPPSANPATIARFGGDEFILACEVQDGEQATALAHQIMADIARVMPIDHHRLEVTCSIGVALFNDDGPDIDSVLQAADLALNHAKQRGRQQILRFDAAMTHRLQRRKVIEADLRQALERGELCVFFQPVVDLATGRIRAFEALARWYHPQKGEIRPDEFIPIAEETGLIITLGNWITAKAIQIAAQWPEQIVLAVNLSPLQIRAPGSCLAIQQALRHAGMAPSRLELEITESVLLDHNQETSAFIDELAAQGVRFALDDFGTGYASLAYLDRYPFSKIKIDRSFVARMDTSKTSQAIISAVATLGQSLGLEVVAEGIETLEQVSAVREAGCTLGQGWYFSRAVPDYLASILLDQESGATETKPKANAAIAAEPEPYAAMRALRRA